MTATSPALDGPVVITGTECPICGTRGSQTSFRGRNGSYRFYAPCGAHWDGVGIIVRCDAARLAEGGE